MSQCIHINTLHVYVYTFTKHQTHTKFIQVLNNVLTTIKFSRHTPRFRGVGVFYEFSNLWDRHVLWDDSLDARRTSFFDDARTSGVVGSRRGGRPVGTAAVGRLSARVDVAALLHAPLVVESGGGHLAVGTAAVRGHVALDRGQVAPSEAGPRGRAVTVRTASVGALRAVHLDFISL